jgi:hypothetical protein
LFVPVGREAFTALLGILFRQEAWSKVNPFLFTYEISMS